MPSTFNGLNIAYMGLLASNAALNTTANNVSNADTEGYSRQYVDQSAAEAIRVFTGYGCVGAGVEVLAVERYRNSFYDIKYWNNNSTLGRYSSQSEYMEELQNYFMDDADSGINGFNTIFSNMYQSIEELAKMPDTDSARLAFVGQASSFCEYFNSMYANLQIVQRNINDEVKICVDNINSIAEEIATINKQINVIEVAGQRANELRDKRELLIDKLSEYVDVETAEYDVVDPNDPDRKTGATRYTIKIAGGQRLVDNSDYSQLIYEPREIYEKVNQSDVDGLYELRWSDGRDFSLNNRAMSGRLRGLLLMRDGNNEEYFHGTVTNIGSVYYNEPGVDLDYQGRDTEKKHNTITVSVDAAYLEDFKKCNLSDSGGVLKAGSNEYIYDYWTYNAEYNTVTNEYEYSYTFVLSNRSEEQYVYGLINKEASIGNSIEYQGIPYYMSQMNEWTRYYAQAFNELMTQEGAVNLYGDEGQNFFLANKDSEGTQWQFSDLPADKDALGNPISYSISLKGSKNDSYYWLTAQTIAVSDSVVKDPGLVATHTKGGDEVSGDDILQQLIELKTSKDMMTFRGCASGEFLQCILSDIAINAQNAASFSDNCDKISQTIQNQRLSVMGVDSDEEGVNLVKFRETYNLACKMIEVMQACYDKLINGTGV